MADNPPSIGHVFPWALITPKAAYAADSIYINNASSVPAKPRSCKRQAQIEAFVVITMTPFCFTMSFHFMPSLSPLCVCIRMWRFWTMRASLRESIVPSKRRFQCIRGGFLNLIVANNKYHRKSRAIRFNRMKSCIQSIWKIRYVFAILVYRERIRSLFD